VKLAIISDIHSNLSALTTTLADIERRDVDAVYCLGDIVGYGPDPGPCVDLVRARCKGVVRGNHDEAVALERNVKWLPRDARKAARHNRKALTAEQIAWLASLPLVMEDDDCCFAHASPGTPERWLRVDNMRVALDQFTAFESDVCFIGHTHVPAILSDRLGLLRVREGNRFLVNVGSVGQPRDGDPRGAYGLFDTESFAYELVRVSYDVEETRRRVTEEHLPRRLGRRLEVGI